MGGDPDRAEAQATAAAALEILAAVDHPEAVALLRDVVAKHRKGFWTEH
jgi:hypothetical protein